MLCRERRKHTIYPSAVNYRGNVWALKTLGCTHILASSACGSLGESIEPGHLAFLDQFIDRTTKRLQKFILDQKHRRRIISKKFVESKEARKRAMINAALDLFEEKGYHRTTIADITSTSGT